MKTTSTLARRVGSGLLVASLVMGCEEGDPDVAPTTDTPNASSAAADTTGAPADAPIPRAGTPAPPSAPPPGPSRGSADARPHDPAVESELMKGTWTSSGSSEPDQEQTLTLIFYPKGRAKMVSKVRHTSQYDTSQLSMFGYPGSVEQETPITTTMTFGYETDASNIYVIDPEYAAKVDEAIINGAPASRFYKEAKARVAEKDGSALMKRAVLDTLNARAESEGKTRRGIVAQIEAISASAQGQIQRWRIEELGEELTFVDEDSKRYTYTRAD